MKKKFLLIISFFQVCHAMESMKLRTDQKSSSTKTEKVCGNSACTLQKPPEHVEYYHEIATHYNPELPELWNTLTREERIFAYYMMRASIPGNSIIADQTHRNAVEIITIFYTIITNKELIYNSCNHLIDVKQFLHEAELFLVYLFAHHGHYFLKEFENHKRTPERLKLTVVTPKNLVVVMKALGLENSQASVDRLQKVIFDENYEPTVVVEGSIEKSAGNMYGVHFTKEDFDTFSPELKAAINAYFSIEVCDGKRLPKVEFYKIGGKYSRELEVAHYWLSKAYEHTVKYPNIFDCYIPESLAYLLKYLETGDENYFKQFSIVWLKTNSRVDFNFGFIETYLDPLHYRGSFEADVTIKAIDMQKLNALLPSLERKLPFPEEFKRQNLDDTAAIPNASVNAKIFASGDAGPLKLTAAYCLPNYQEIRAEYGSKQIIYQAAKGLDQLLNPTLSRTLFTIQEHAHWLEENDPEMKLKNDIWNVQVILHETLGHGSGRGTTHTFVEGDPLKTIGGITYKVGDVISVTSENITEFFGGYTDAFEELRAEILALYTSIYNFDELAAAGLYKDWPTKVSKEKLIELVIIEMARLALHRLMGQKDDAKEIVQAHSIADTAILNYLLDHGGIELVKEIYYVQDNPHTVIGVRVRDLQKTIDAVKEMACEVQRCASTADVLGVNYIMKNYGTCVRYPEYIKILKANRKTVQGDLVEVVEIFPRLIAIVDEHNTLIDVAGEWPNSFLEQQLELYELAYSKELNNRLLQSCCTLR